MFRFFHQLWKSRFARSVAIVASGTLVAQFIALVFSPIITRLYGPEAFGILGTYMAMLALLTPITALSYPIAIVLPKHDRDAINLIILSIKIGFVTSIVVGLILLFTKDLLLSLLNIGEVGKFIWLVPFAMLFSVLLSIATQWSVRKKLFKFQAKVAVAYSFIQNGLKSGIALFAPYAWVLIVIATVGSIINAAMLYLGLRRNEQPDFTNRNGWQAQKQLAKVHSDFAYYRTPQIVLNTASQSMPILMVTALFGPAAAGFYTLATMVLGVPARLIGQSVHTVFYPHFNEAILENRSGLNLLLKATISLSIVGAGPFLIIIFFGPSIFSFVFGDDWLVAGQLAQWLSPWLFISLAARPSIAAISVLNMQKQFLLFEVLAVLMRIVSLILSYTLFESLLSTVAIFSIANCLIFSLLILGVGLRANCSSRPECNYPVK